MGDHAGAPQRAEAQIRRIAGITLQLRRNVAARPVSESLIVSAAPLTGEGSPWRNSGTWDGGKVVHSGPEALNPGRVGGAGRRCFRSMASKSFGLRHSGSAERCDKSEFPGRSGTTELGFSGKIEDPGDG